MNALGVDDGQKKSRGLVAAQHDGNLGLRPVRLHPVVDGTELQLEPVAGGDHVVLGEEPYPEPDLLMVWHWT